jgi:hypothetical protein
MDHRDVTGKYDLDLTEWRNIITPKSADFPSSPSKIVWLVGTYEVAPIAIAAELIETVEQGASVLKSTALLIEEARRTTSRDLARRSKFQIYASVSVHCSAFPFANTTLKKPDTSETAVTSIG